MHILSQVFEWLLSGLRTSVVHTMLIHQAYRRSLDTNLNSVSKVTSKLKIKALYVKAFKVCL